MFDTERIAAACICAGDHRSGLPVGSRRQISRWTISVDRSVVSDMPVLALQKEAAAEFLISPSLRRHNRNFLNEKSRQ